ncbi:MAG: class I SAM-dependent methyltransferase [Chloroflexota bacterium]|nr:MAG: class I SAM-dependent methyltransferase [Chloroflexota bacterium]
MNAEQYARMREAEDTHWWYVGTRAIAADAIGRLALPPGSRILDAGCGTAGNLAMLCRFGSVVGIDVSGLALDLAAARVVTDSASAHRRWFVRASVEQLPLFDRSFDLVTSFEVLYHRAVRDDVAALREFRRALRPGGYVLLRLPAFEWLRGAHDRAVHTERRYTAAGLATKLDQAGFQLVDVTHVNALLLPVVVLKRAVERLTGAVGDDLAPTPGFVDAVCRAALAIERRVLRLRRLPLGVSLQAIARRVD